MARVLWKLANNTDPASLASKLRQKRTSYCHEIVTAIPKPMKVLNVGGVENELRALGVVDEPAVSCTILNVYPVPTTAGNVISVVGDARNMHQFRNKEFDFAFSNSVIEHVGGYEGARQMAEEIRRVSRRYFVQTPNRNFPIEPHFLVPLFQFLPLALRAKLVQSFRLGWCPKTPDAAAAQELVASVNLLTTRQMGALFPDAVLVPEKLFGLTKSIQSVKTNVEDTAIASATEVCTGEGDFARNCADQRPT